MRVTLIDGPLGTELLARGVATPLPGWSAHAITTAPAVVRAIHSDYESAGASLHTANTFRTRKRVFPSDWRALARTAVELTRASVSGRVAGSIAPLEDCYRPDLSPANEAPETTRAEHAELAGELHSAGCDLLLCETFPHVREGLLALEAALATGLESWLSFTPGYAANLLTPDEVGEAARAAVHAGASAVLVNCAPARSIESYVTAIAQRVGNDVPIGCYANAGEPEDAMGWTSQPGAPERYAEVALSWQAAGATLIGGCCGTGPAHVAALAAAFGQPSDFGRAT